MGSKLAVLAAQLSFVGIAAAQPAPSKTCLEQYKAGKYAEAAACFEQAYQLEPKPETLFALAQAYRLAGKCDKAVPLYKKLLSQTTELAAAKAVQNNLGMCPGGEPPPVRDEPKVEPKGDPKVEPQPQPQVQTKTIVREVRKTDPLAVGLLAGGALGGGFAIGMILRSSSTRDAADRARTLDDANDLHDRADQDRLVAIIAGGASAVAIGFAVFRLMRGDESSTTEVAVTPTPGGSMMVLSKVW